MKRFQKMKRVISLLMACLLVLGLSTTALASNSPVVDNSKPMVNVFFSGNHLNATVCRVDENGVEDTYYASIGEMVQVGSSFGTMVSDIKVANSDTEAEFSGWMVCYPVYELDEDGQRQIHHWELFEQKMYTTAEALAYTVPSNYAYDHMAFMAQWSGGSSGGIGDSGTSEPAVNVFFSGNNPYATVCRVDENGVEDECYPSIGEMIPFGSSFGTMVSDIKVANSDTEAKFLGWMVCYPVYELDEDGNPIEDEYGWKRIHHWEVFEQKMYTTAEALAYRVPLDYSYDHMAFMAQWSSSSLPDSGGEPEEGKIQINVFANGGKFTFTGSFENGEEVAELVKQYEIGSTLRKNGIEFTDPVIDGLTFLGWKAFVPGELGPNMTPIENIPLLTTEQLLEFKLPDYPILFIAQYNNGAGNQGGSGGNGEADVPGDALNFFLYGGGGRFDYKYYDGEAMQTAKNAGLFVYSIDNDKAFKQCMDDRGDGLVNIYKQCAKLKGWELYTCDHVEFYNVPAGQDPAIGDEDMTLKFLDEIQGRDYYAIMVNAVKADGLKTTDEIYNLTAGKDYFATLVWEDAHAANTAVVENRVAPTTIAEGSYDSVVYCKGCGVELARTSHTIEKLTETQIQQTTNKVESIVSGSGDVTEKKEEIVNTINKDIVKEAMVTKPEFKETMKDFEEAYVNDAEVNITVEKPKVDEAVKDVVKAESIEVVGAGLNAEKDSTVKLDVAKVEKEKEVPAEFKNVVQVDIKLLVTDKNTNATSSKEELDIPLVITMDIPAGVSPENLVILHFHGDTTVPELITPEVNGNKITFAVDKFSTFVFANAENTANVGSFYYYLDAYTGNNTVLAPKTGDNNVALIFAVFAVVTAGVVVFRRKVVK